MVRAVNYILVYVLTCFSGILHVDYESLIPYLSESIKQNFRDISDMKADASQIHQVVDKLYAEFIKKEQKKINKSTTVNPKQHPRNHSLRWIIGTSLAVLLLVSVAIGVFFIVPLVRPAQNIHNLPEAPNTPLPGVSSPPQSTTPSAFSSIDQEVLVDLFYATGGSKYWGVTASPSMSVCDWLCVKCDENFRVVAIQLDKYQNLAGTIPYSIGKLDKLQILQLPYQNKISGTIPASIGNLTSLVKLHLIRSQLTGTVPLEIFSLVSLQTLEISDNANLSWTIPPQIGNLKNLKIFDAHVTGLHGTLPDEISKLTKLEGLSVGSNNLIGTVPSLAKTSVRRLKLENNHFTGPIPKLNEQLFIENEKLELAVSIANNSFSGEFDLPIAPKTMNYFDFTNNIFSSVSLDSTIGPQCT